MENTQDLIELNRQKDVSQYLHYNSYDLNGKLVPLNTIARRTLDQNELYGTLRSSEDMPNYLSKQFDEEFEGKAIISHNDRIPGEEVPDDAIQEPVVEVEKPVYKPPVVSSLKPKVITKVLDPTRLSVKL